MGFGHTRREGNYNGLSSPYSKTLMKVQQVNLDWVGYLDHILLNDCCQLTKAKSLGLRYILAVNVLSHWIFPCLGVLT